MRMISRLVVLMVGLVVGCADVRGGNPPAAAAERRGELRVMSFNVRTSSADDGADAWPLRKEFLVRTIRAYDPDLLGTQEVRPDQYDYLTEQLGDYTPIGAGRDDGRRKGEFSLILVRKKRFDVGKSGTFWLSERPEEPGSKSWDTAITRVCSWAVVTDRETGKELLFANTHFDHRGTEARLHSAELLTKRLPELAAGRPIVLTGDFNFNETAPPYRVLTGEGRLVDSYRKVHPTVAADEASFNGFKPQVNGKRIDFIFHTPDVTATDAAIDRTKSPDGRFPSDHYPVTATLKM